MATEPDAPPLPHPTEGPEYFPPIVTDETTPPPDPVYTPAPNQIQPNEPEPPPDQLPPAEPDPMYIKVASVWDQTVDFPGMDEFKYQPERLQDRIVKFYQLVLAEPGQS